MWGGGGGGGGSGGQMCVCWGGGGGQIIPGPLFEKKKQFLDVRWWYHLHDKNAIYRGKNTKYSHFTGDKNNVQCTEEKYRLQHGFHSLLHC